MGGVLGAPGGEPLDVGGRVRAAGAPVEVVDEAGEEVRPPGLAGLEALEAGVEAVVVEAQLGAGADRLEIEGDRSPDPIGGGLQTSTLQRTRDGRSASSTRITTSWSPINKRSVSPASAPPPAGVHQPVGASMSVSAENTASGAAAKVFVERKSSVVVGVVLTAGSFLMV